MRKWLMIGLVLVLIVAGAWGYKTFGTSKDAGNQTAQQSNNAGTNGDLENVIWASGNLAPLRWAGLSTANTGIVSQIHVAEGDEVKTGDLLLELDNAVLQSQVKSAEAAEAEAEAARAKLLAGATAAEIAAAKAQVAAAKAKVALAAGQMLETQAAIDVAKAQAATAKQQYAELASHPTQAEVAVAQADIGIAQAAVNQTQAAYNQVRGDPQITSRPESMALYQATASLEAAKARADMTKQGATPQQLAVAQSQIAAAEATVNQAASQAPGVEASVKAAMAEQDSAQAELDRLLAGATKEDIAMANARVHSAQAAVESAKAALLQTQIVAPFDGQVGTINVRVGEMATAEKFLILLGDTRQMHVETTDLRETDVVRLRLSMPVEVTFDALPGRVFQGTITRIAPVSNTEKGSTNYTVDVDVAKLDPSLRWGMTAFVNIQAPKP